LSGVLATLPFAVWLFLAIEQLPLAAEESADPKEDMPKGLILGMTTLMISALLTVFLNSGIGSMEAGKMHGASSLATSSEPLLDGFRVLYGGAAAKTLALLAVIGGMLLNMAVFGAMISYAMQGLSFILLRRNLPDIERPYRSPLGVFGAGVTIAIALVTLYFQLQDPVYRNGVYAAAVFYLVGLAYFALVGRHRLILSPEEEFAMKSARPMV
jgi:amino acid transporter